MAKAITEADLTAMYRLGFQNALEMTARLARTDKRVKLAKDCGYVPGWQKGRWMVADQLDAILAEGRAKGLAANASSTSKTNG